VQATDMKCRPKILSFFQRGRRNAVIGRYGQRRRLSAECGQFEMISVDSKVLQPTVEPIRVTGTQ